MKQALLIAEALSTVWAILPDRLAAVAMVLARWQAGRAADPATLASIRADAGARAQRRAGSGTTGGVQILRLFGIITQHGDRLDDVSGPGSVSTGVFAQGLRAALADDSVGGIVIDIDSPGGSVYGVAELSNEIYQARQTKPIYAIANSVAASAAYWIGAAASQTFVTPGGEVGSIGVFAAHDDISKALEAEGIKTTLVSAGKFKTEGNAFEPLGDDARRALQSRIDSYYQMFTRSVAKSRGVPVDRVRDGMGQGRVVGAADAVSENMVDDVLTFDQVVGKMTRVLRDARTPAERLARASAGSPGAAARAAQRQRDIDLHAPPSQQGADQARARQAQRARDLERYG